MVRILGLLTAIWISACAIWAQLPDDARRRADLNPIQLAGGSRVEFKTFYSQSLGRDQAYSIFLPPSYDKEAGKTYPVIYFLHGMNNDHTSWTVTRYGNLQEKVEALISSGKIPEIIMIHPDGDNSFYTNSCDGTKKYEDFIVKDLIQHIEQNYRVKKGRQHRAIAGTSMGGYGALKLAFKYPELFAAVAGQSPIILLGDNPFDVPEEVKASRFYMYFKGLLSSIFGDPINIEHWQDNNVLALLKRNSNKLQGLKIYFDYGTNDRYNQTIKLNLGCQALHRALEEAKIPHVFKEHQGEPHGWALVAAHMDETLPFLCQTFR